MAEDFLPIQTATRPEPAAKPASQPDDAGGVTFGELLDAQAKDQAQANDQTKDTAAKADVSGDTGGDDAVAADPSIPASTQAAPAPAPAPAAPAQNAVAMMMAALQSYSTQPGQAAEGTAEPVTTDGGVVAANATRDETAVSAPAATPAAPAAAEPAAPEAQSAAPTAASTAAAPKAAKPAETADTGEAETSGDANKTDAAKAAPAPAVKADATEVVAPVAQAAVAAAPVAVQTTAPAVSKPAIKPTEAAKESASAPGAERAADDGEATAANTSANGAGAAKASGQATSPASSQANGAQTNAAQANAVQTTADAAADAKVDIATATTTASTPSADALVKGGQTADAPKSHPALANASPAVAQVYASMVQRADGRAQRFEIRLDPAELGRVDVRIEVGADKKVHAVLAAHDSAALSDLMRGQKALERALSDAGIDLADGGLQFEMSRDSGQSLNGNNPQGDAHSNSDNANVWRRFSTVDVGVDANAADLATATRSYRRAASRLDLVA
jgi:flagellar hook-length control protein FliK